MIQRKHRSVEYRWAQAQRRDTLLAWLGLSAIFGVGALFGFLVGLGVAG